MAKAQLSVEMVIIAAVMIGLLLAMFLVNENLRSGWEGQKESLEASTAANQLAIAINKAVAGGNGTSITFANLVGADVTNMSIYDSRSVRAHYIAGSYSSAPLVTNNTNVTGDIPINQGIIIRNIDGKITIEAG